MAARHFKVRVSLPGLLCSSLAVVLLAGCGNSPEKTYPVSGTVTLDGKPVIAGTLVFERVTADEEGEVFTGRATIGPDGRYSVSTFGEDDGAVAGLHRVVVIPDPNASAVDRPSYVKELPRVLPERYTLPEKPFFEFEVKQEPNDIDIEMSTKDPAS